MLRDPVSFASIVKSSLPTVIIQGVATFLIYIVLRFRFRTTVSSELKLKKKTREQLIRDYRSEALPGITYMGSDSEPVPVKYNFANYDVFELGSKFKDKIKSIIKEYGIGTCGPRGFYGTLDIHMDLEKQLSELYHKEGCVLYSNYFTGLQTIVSCFCRSKNTVYFFEEASEPILRGVSNSKAGSVMYSSLEDLRQKLVSASDIKDRYVVAEEVSKNTGRAMDIETLGRMREELGFRLILDTGHSVPFLVHKPSANRYACADVVVGALCYGYPGNGGFACGSMEVTDYQRLNAHAYVFSASMPAYLTKAALCFLSAQLDYEKIRERAVFARTQIRDAVEGESPVLLVKCEDPRALQKKLRAQGYPVGVNGRYLRVCVSVGTDDSDIIGVADAIKASS